MHVARVERCSITRGKHQQEGSCSAMDMGTAVSKQRIFGCDNKVRSCILALRAVGASESTNLSLPSLWSTLDVEILSPRLLHPGLDTPATKAQAEDVFVSNMGTPLTNR